MNYFYLYLAVTFLCAHAVNAGSVLNEYIQRYEPLNYNTDRLHNDHQRIKRSATKDRNLSLKFKAHGRKFNLRLWPDNVNFLKNAEMIQPDGSKVPLDTSHIYVGEIVGDYGSHVHGSIIAKIFTGKITTGRGISYWIEHADKYFDDAKPFHSIMYAESDVVDEPHRHKRSADHGSCGLNEKIRRWMNEQQNSFVEEPEVKVSKRSVDGALPRSNFGFYEHESRAYHNIYSNPTEYVRKKRANKDERACNIFMQSDYKLWDRMTNSRKNKGLDYSKDRAKEEITSIFSTHINGVRKIYEDTHFTTYDGSIQYNGITFMVHRTKIAETDKECPQGALTPNKMICQPNIDVSNFLNLNSLQNHDDYCLAYMFTYRDFTGGTLGLAWVASASRASGGICEKNKEYVESSNSNHPNNKVRKSLNTGIVTLINYGTTVPPKVSTLTLAHEIGHNFGSQHDSGSKCTPYSASPSDPNGNFIMFASATSGDRPNNSKFSPCSKDNISIVLDQVINSKNGKSNCFLAREAAYCGNRIVEKGEQCDCGFEQDCEDQCCYGRNTSDSRQCTRKKDVDCSPSEGPCCTHDCKLVKKSKSWLCRSKSDCEAASYCDGLKPACPKSQPMPNKTYCNDYTQVCFNGVCSSSVCTKISWDQCYLEAPVNDKSYDKGKLCYVSCQNPNSKKCVSTGDAIALNAAENKQLKQLLDDIGFTSIKLKPGAPCNNFRGYCDVFQKCRDVDADGPLARLKKLIFNEATFNEIRNWIIKHWYAVLVMGIALIILMGIFIKVCAVHTPSSNPKKPPPRKLMTLPRKRPQGPPPPYSGPNRVPQQGYGKGRGPKRVAQYEMHPPKA